MAKFLSIIGSRPQYMKVLGNLPNHVICDTGQHYDKNMSDVFIRGLKVKVKHHLNETDFGHMLSGCTNIIERENPEIVIVYGDTRSTLGGALAAKFSRKVLAHVESGMRSYDMTQPEEIVRVIVDRISDYKFCVNKQARQNLRDEGILKNVFVVGDPMWDSLNRVLPIPKSKDYGMYNILTIHREQSDKKEFLENIFSALEKSGERFVFPVHPRTKKSIKLFRLKLPKNIKVIEPLDYKKMISLVTNCKKVVTDSGGLTREAAWFGKPVIILRSETEWNDIVKDGWAILVGNDRRMISDALKNFNPKMKETPRTFVPEFGSNDRIKEILIG